MVNKSLMPDGEAPEPIDDWITRANTALNAIPQAIDDEFNAITAEAETLTPGSSATASFNSQTKKLTIGVPEGQQGEPGYTPVRGTDYWTEEDQAEMRQDIASDTAAARQAIADDKAAAELAITQDKNAAQQAISEDRAAAITAIGNKGTEQVGAVADKGAEVLASIPSDYTELSNDVSGLKSAITMFENMLGDSGKFSPSNTWLTAGSATSYSVSDDIASVTPTARYSGLRTYQSFMLTSGHKFYAFAKIKASHKICLSFNGAGAAFTNGSSDSFEFVSSVYTGNGNSNPLTITDNNESDWGTIQAKETGIIDLTQTYGENVPSKEDLDKIIPSFGFFVNAPVGKFVNELYLDVLNCENEIGVLQPSASVSDVGKFLKAKTVSGGKVTEYEFGSITATVDSSLSTSSENPVQNKVITNAISEITDEEKLLRDNLPGTTTTVTMDSNGNPTSIVHSADGTTVRTDAFVWSTGSVTETRTASGKYITITTNLETLAQTVSEIQEVA